MPIGPIYDALADSTRRRILHLLNRGPLCVCHFQAILGEPQVKVSKHLAYLRQRKLVVALRRKKWVIYSLPTRPSHALAANLHCLATCAADDPLLRRDIVRLHRVASSVADALLCTC